jgi:hypothetical protein
MNPVPFHHKQMRSLLGSFTKRHLRRWVPSQNGTFDVGILHKMAPLMLGSFAKWRLGCWDIQHKKKLPSMLGPDTKLCFPRLPRLDLTKWCLVVWRSCAKSFAGRFCLHAAGLPLTSKASSHNLSYKCEAPRDPPCVARMFVMAILLQVPLE